MDLSVILTYRCDSRCSMCYVWKNPTHPDYEVDIKTLHKLPGGFDYLNITGGEPTLRKDLMEVCDLLYPKTKKLEISTNGLHIEILESIVKKYPDIKIRISIEGFESTNDKIRGEKEGYKKKIDVMNKLIKAGGTDLGFATTFQDENIDEIADIFKFTRELKIELATSALHNAFQFHKNDNYMYDRMRVAKGVEKLIKDMIGTWSVKTWFRAYLNLGLMSKILGHKRLHPCTQGTDSVFIDPWGDTYACNVRNDLHIGNLREQSWEEIFNGERALKVRDQVAACTQNCWMVSSAKTAIRNMHFAQLPKVSVLGWVLINKTRSLLGLRIPFERYIDYGIVKIDAPSIQRVSYLDKIEKKELQPSVSRRYVQFDGFFNN